ncbi:Crp/Fnr family transcriptional regulator [Pseudoalteromonas sp. SSM20]|uniref:Crp/Fnr family transcriptional regulator n=1 Tax=Pseudoalteromonas sp. SSM20 TaxID=3139394 RepID=UPI003BA88C0F
MSTELILNSGQTLFKQGDKAERMYVVRSGKIKLIKSKMGQSVVLGYFGTGEFLGEMAIITGSKRSCTAIAAEDSVLQVYESARFEEMLANNSGVAARIIEGLAVRLEKTTERLMEPVTLLEAETE